MDSKIIIRILSGGRKGQTESMPLAPDAHITLGRSPGNTVAFDRDADTTVSREHAVIQVNDTATAFTLIDSGSMHGTLLNGSKIEGPTQISLGDKISLGPQTSFTFDVDPRPEGYVAATKKVAIPDALGAKTTKIDLSGYDGARAGQAPASPRATVENAKLLTSRPDTGRSVAIYAAAALAAVVAIGGYFAWHHFRATDGRPAQVASSQELSTRDIADRYSKATVFVGVKWRLYDKDTGKPVYQKCLMAGDNKIYLYVTLKDKGVIPWLTTDDDNGVNAPIGFEGSGSGFLETSDGLILTNKHVAAGWKIKYDDLPENGYIASPDMTIQDVYASMKDERSVKERLFKPAESQAATQLKNWVPGDGGPLFEADRAVLIGSSDRDFDGRDEELFVQFPGSNQRHVATLENFASDADIASIRISQAGGSYTAIPLSTDDAVRLGEKIVVIGYPGISQKIISAKKVETEAGNAHTEYEFIREPTVTDGVIANLGLSGQSVTQGETIGTMGDAYQLTVLATGHGNSGGPVINAQGRVIGIFTYSSSQGDERVTYAVPIKYARQFSGH